MTENTFSTQTLSKDIKDFSNLDPQKKMIVAGIVLLLFIGSIFVGAYLSRGSAPTPDVNNPRTTDQQAPNVPTKKPSTALKIEGQNTMKIGQTQTISVILSNIAVTASDIVVSFDPEIFTVLNVKNGIVFPKVIQNKINATDGMIIFSGSVDPSNPNDLKQGEVMSFTIKANKEAKASLLQLNRDETITAINGENTLGLTSGLSIKVNK